MLSRRVFQSKRVLSHRGRPTALRSKSWEWQRFDDVESGLERLSVTEQPRNKVELRLNDVRFEWDSDEDALSCCSSVSIDSVFEVR